MLKSTLTVLLTKAVEAAFCIKAKLEKTLAVVLSSATTWWQAKAGAVPGPREVKQKSVMRAEVFPVFERIHGAAIWALALASASHI